MGLTEFLMEEIMRNSPLGNFCEEEIPPKRDSPEHGIFAEKRHDGRIIRLAEHLIKIGYCETASPFFKYNINGINGEVDLLTSGRNGETWFEIKYRFNPSRLAKAITQFKRYNLAFPEFEGRAYFVSCDGMVIEISNEELLKQFD